MWVELTAPTSDGLHTDTCILTATVRILALTRWWVMTFQISFWDNGVSTGWDCTRQAVRNHFVFIFCCILVTMYFRRHHVLCLPLGLCKNYQFLGIPHKQINFLHTKQTVWKSHSMLGKAPLLETSDAPNQIFWWPTLGLWGSASSSPALEQTYFSALNFVWTKHISSCAHEQLNLGGPRCLLLFQITHQCN